MTKPAELSTRQPSSLAATAIGAIAIALWATLALLTTSTGSLPPFQVLGITFGIAAGLSLVGLGASGQLTPAAFRIPWPAWLLSVGGLFGYHALYFTALKSAPPADASLIAYLWPLFIVLMSALLPGQRLAPLHVVAALCGLAGTALLITQNAAAGPRDGAVWFGYACAFGCALTWSGYSVLNRLQAAVPVAAMMPVCAVVALLGFAAHGLTETWVVPDWTQLLALVALGAGPVGLAFFVWDYGTKRGDLPLLGVLSYASPVLSTLLLVAFGRAAPSWPLAAACVLIVGGAALASLSSRG
jgi:drug/metabolite transporter (DMT)-like permease